MDRYTKALEILKYAISNQISIRAAQKDFGVGKSYIYDVKNSLSNLDISSTEYTNFIETYDNYVNSPDHASKKKAIIDDIDTELNEYLDNTDNDYVTEYDATSDEEYDKRNIGTEIRNSDNKIDKYYYKIYIKNKQPLEGFLSRDEMDYIYRFYSSMGESNTIREISRFFTNISFIDIKRILRAFNITKASTSFSAPHIMEELSDDEIIERTFRQKEVNILNKINNQNSLKYKLLYEKAMKELISYKENEDWINKIIENRINTKKRENFQDINIIKNENKKPLIVLFADIHFGKKYDYPIFGRGYNSEIAKERMLQIALDTIEEAKTNKYSEIVYIFVGDLLESMNEEGMHTGHIQEMQQDLLQEKQIFFACDVLKEMLLLTKNETNLNIELHAIGGNHDRISSRGSDARNQDKNRTGFKICMKVLERELKYHNIKVIIPENNILKIIKNNLFIFAQHGDSLLSKKSATEIINLYNVENKNYSLILQGHWHSYKMNEGTKFIEMKLPSVCSSDKFILEELGNSVLPGYLIGYESNRGFDFKKITLY